MKVCTWLEGKLLFIKKQNIGEVGIKMWKTYNSFKVFYFKLKSDKHNKLFYVT